LLIFKYTPLSEAVAEVNRYNTDKVVIAEAAVADRTIYGTVPTQNIDAFVRVAKNALGLHVAKRGNEYVISRRDQNVSTGLKACPVGLPKRGN
jgi:transmembrane sensor